MGRKRIERGATRHRGMKPRLMRLLDILCLASSQVPWTAGRLAGRCGVSERTIFKDVAFLNRAGLRIVPGRDGYKLVNKAVALPVTLSFEELHGVLRPGSRDEASWRSAQEKLAQALPPSVRGLYCARGRLKARPAVAPAVAGIAQQVEEAVSAGVGLEIVYEDLGGGVRRRVVNPHGLFLRGSAWYLVAWSHERSDWRQFRLDRIRSAREAARFERRGDFDLDAHLRDMWGAWKGGFLGARVEVLSTHVTAMKSEAAARGLRLKREGGRAVLEIERGDEREVAWWLAQFGEGVRVLEPASLRARLAALGRRIVELNGGGLNDNVQALRSGGPEARGRR